MSYFTHAINQSPTIYGEAAADMTAPAMKVVAFDNNGKIILPASGETPIGVVLADAADVKAGGRLNIQVKDICYVLTGASVKRGQNLKAKTRRHGRARILGRYRNRIRSPDAATASRLR